MAGGINKTGVPLTKDYNLGRGILYFALLDASGNPKGWRDLGNCPEFKLTVNVDELVHEASRTGSKIEDASATLKRAVAWSAQLDTIEFDNMGLFLAGTVADAVTNGTVAGFTEYAMISTANGGVEMGRWYDIVSSTGVRCYNITAADLTVEKSGAPDVAMVLGTDYTLDLKLGRIFFLSTGIVVVAGDQIDVTLVAAAGAGTVQKVRALSQSTIVGALKFCAVNPNDSDNPREVQLHRVTVNSDGDLGFISDDWIKLGLKGKITKSDSTRFVLSPYMDITALTGF